MQNPSLDVNVQDKKRWKWTAIAGKIKVLSTQSTPDMNTTQRNEIMQRWRVLQHELLPELRHEVGVLTPKLEQAVHTLDWVKMHEFVGSIWCGNGRPHHDQTALASAFVA